MSIRLASVLLVIALFAISASARQPSITRPPEDRPANEPALNSVEQVGWGLQGVSGRHYFFGGLAIADYNLQGRHKIVSLESEKNSADADPKFLYYRELADGNRWAVSRNADRDRNYLVYFQEHDANPNAKWVLFHRARLIEDSRFPDSRRQASGDSPDAPPRPTTPRGNPADRRPVLSRPNIILAEPCWD